MVPNHDVYTTYKKSLLIFILLFSSFFFVPSQRVLFIRRYNNFIQKATRKLFYNLSFVYINKTLLWATFEGLFCNEK